MKKILFTCAVLFLQTTFQKANAQNLNWVKQMGGASNDVGKSIIVDAFGNVYTIGTFSSTVDFDPGPGTFNLSSFGSSQDIFITKLNTSGNLVWAQQLGGTSYDGAYALTVDGLGNVYATGYFNGTADFDPEQGVYNLISGGSDDVFVAKLDASGSLVWAKRLGGGGGVDQGHSIAIDALGNVFITGYFQGTSDFDPGSGTLNLSSQGVTDAFITKLDASGNLLWAIRLGGTISDVGRSITVDASGDAYLTGVFSDTTDFDPGPNTFNLVSNGQTDVFIIKLDALGNLVWAKQLGGIDADEGRSITFDAFGNVYVTGWFFGTVDFDPGPGTFNLTTSGYQDAFIVKLDASGNLLWAKQLGGSNDDRGYSIATDTSGSIYITGGFVSTADFDPGIGTFNLTSAGGGDIYITKLDASGNLVWAKSFGSNTASDIGQSIALGASGSVYATGEFGGTIDFDPSVGTFSLTASGHDVFVLKLTQLPPYIIQGNVFADRNVNCSQDTSDNTLSSFLVKVAPGIFYGLSDWAGNYRIYIFDTGSYTISIATQDTFWQPSCTTSYNLQITTIPDTAIGINFALRASYYCPRLTVELGIPRLRRCFNNTYTFTYRNTGSLPASNAYMELDFGEYLQPLSSSLPWSTVSGNVYTFPIGNLNINQNGSFTVEALLDCAARKLGSTQCVTAHIYPDSSCVPPPTGWDKSDTRVRGACVNDSLVCFTIKNVSSPPSGDMQGPAQWRLYVNDTLITQGTYQLAGGDSLMKCYPANGKTYRLEADQRLGPDNSQPKAIVEGCGSPVNFGFVNTVAQDDEALFVETFCMEVTGSYDPNDKSVSPAGITSNQYISAGDELEYLIRFQNTGTDTAFKVIIRDTIATDVLDIVTLKSGASSHPYTFNIYGSGIAEWTFDNILLPDSNVNEPESHGFVKFKINQLPGNNDGTRIENRAAIYFDFNAPVITNTTWNVVNEAAMPVSLLAASIIHSSDIRCYGDSSGSADASASGGLTPYQYSWSHGEMTETVSNLAGGNYSVTITDAAGTQLTDSVSIIEPALLSATIDSVTHVLCYANGTGSATASATDGTPPYSYEWSNHGSAFATATSLNAGVYWVTMWDANLCTVTTSSVTITEPPQLIASVSTQSSVTCFGGSDGAVKAVSTGGVTPHAYQWSSGDTSSTAENLSAGNHQITVTDANGCFLVTSVAIQDGYQINTGSITGADTAGINQTVTYRVNAGFGYTWNVTNGTIISGQNTNSIEVDWSTIGQGTLEVAVTNSGCTQMVSKTVTLIDYTGIYDNVLSGITIIPNPTHDLLHIRWDKGLTNFQNLSNLNVILSDVCGKQLQSIVVENSENFTLSLREYHSGIYLLAVKGNSQRTFRLIKME